MNESESSSVPHKRAGVTVAASPFNGVKLELGLIIVLAGVLVLVSDRLVDSVGAQLALLAGAGGVFTLWLYLRTRRVLKKSSATPIEDQDGQKQE